jgi:segregation and condensation protein B
MSEVIQPESPVAEEVAPESRNDGPAVQETAAVKQSDEVDAPASDAAVDTSAPQASGPSGEDVAASAQADAGAAVAKAEASATELAAEAAGTPEEASAASEQSDAGAVAAEAEASATELVAEASGTPEDASAASALSDARAVAAEAEAPATELAAEAAGTPEDASAASDTAQDGASQGEDSPEEVGATEGQTIVDAAELFAESTVVAASADDERALQRAMVEAAIYITEEPLTLDQIVMAMELPKERIQEILAELVETYSAPAHGITIREIAGGYKMATKPEHHERIRAFVKKLKPPLKLSLAALETLAVIAYKQPITAPEIMEVRGVQGAGVLKTLIDRKLITPAGRKQVVGKPILYKTTKEFLVQFGLKDLSELPTLKEFEELRRLAFNDDEPQAEAAPAASVSATAPPSAETGAPPAETEATKVSRETAPAVEIAEASEVASAAEGTPESQSNEPAVAVSE